jgi:hypothetical protein
MTSMPLGNEAMKQWGWTDELMTDGLFTFIVASDDSSYITVREFRNYLTFCPWPAAFLAPTRKLLHRIRPCTYGLGVDDSGRTVAWYAVEWWLNDGCGLRTTNWLLITDYWLLITEYWVLTVQTGNRLQGRRRYLFMLCDTHRRARARSAPELVNVQVEAFELFQALGSRFSALGSVLLVLGQIWLYGSMAW